MPWLRLISLCVLARNTIPVGERGVPCNEQRNTWGAGTIADGTRTLGSATIDLSEFRDSTRFPNVYMRGDAADSVTGGPLKGHVASMRLLNATGEVLSARMVDQTAQLPLAIVFWENWSIYTA